MSIILSVLFWLLLKHLLVDFFYQTPYMYLNKGNFKHPGGYLHAINHGWFTFTILAPIWSWQSVTWEQALTISIVESFIHFWIDWGKVNLNKGFGWTPNHSQFWNLLGVGQYLHNLTYLGILCYIAKGLS